MAETVDPASEAGMNQDLTSPASVERGSLVDYLLAQPLNELVRLTIVPLPRIEYDQLGS